ncbi:SDR family oxidoreductase [Microlunatus flavus]|uniref:NADP-dependent 3-hydroxy acid dehydrogenase YdfG n=1 Tax=Microlunatus flavus TaxID=1036181 RepID=A0A1H9JHE4_9ACTN|nr:SDR family NAD(P)-dependent oxidoreductase [Microlunatus flavus]SEQ86199.1 NADP-dependent 3-hydroxy acid dehydrogenase YdfG [Microlunatus flavus]
MSLDRDLAGTVVAITGATAGIGRATARALVAEGARVVLLGRRQERLDELVAELGADAVAAVAGDVADPATNAAVVAAAQERFGRLDSLVANAGIGAYGGIMSMTDDEIRTMDATNFLGTVFSVRAVVPTFREQSGGDVVVVSSVAGLRGGPWEAVYAGTKHAQVGLAGSLDRELREHGIRVTTICPAAVSTEFAIGTGRNAGDEWLEHVLAPEDVADAIVTVLRQSRRLRTQQWVLRAMAEES